MEILCVSFFQMQRSMLGCNLLFDASQRRHHICLNNIQNVKLRNVRWRSAAQKYKVWDSLWWEWVSDWATKRHQGDFVKVSGSLVFTGKSTKTRATLYVVSRFLETQQVILYVSKRGKTNSLWKLPAAAAAARSPEKVKSTATFTQTPGLCVVFYTLEPW